MASKHERLTALRNKVNKSYNSHVSSAGTHREWKRISTGILAADYAYGINSHGVGGPAVGLVHGLVGWESCIDGDAEVIVSRAGESSRITMRELVRRFNGGATSGMAWDPTIPTRVQGMSGDGRGRLHTVVKALHTGKKGTVRVVTDTGREIVCTPDHEIWTSGGWVPVEEVGVGGRVFVVTEVGPSDVGGNHDDSCRGVEETIVAIDDAGIRDVYDITVLEDAHNFTANGFVVHNSGKTSMALRIVSAWQKCCARCHRPAKDVHEVQILSEDGTPHLDDNGNPAYMLDGRCDCYATGEWKGPKEPEFKGRANEKKEQMAAWEAELEALKENSYEPMVVAYFDVEKTLDTVWARKLGVFVRCIEVIEPGYAEQCIDMVDEYIRSLAVDLVVVDSIPAMVPMTEIEESSEDWQRGLQARLINKAVRKWVGSANQAATNNDEPRLVTQIWIQQWRQTMQQFSGNTMPGGMGQKFAFATLMDFRISDRQVDEKFGKRMDLSEKDSITATFSARNHIKARKNKTATDREVSYRMAYMDDDQVVAGHVFDQEYIFKMAMSTGVVVRDGAKYTFRGRTFTSQSAIQEMINSSPEVKAWVQREILKVLHSEYGP